MGLLGEPAGGGAAEDFGEADGHFRGDAALAVEEKSREIPPYAGRPVTGSEPGRQGVGLLRSE
jgi:hypothetical protein